MKKYFIPPSLSINELATVLTGNSVSTNVRIVNQACLLYTILCKDYVSLRMSNNSEGYTQVKWETLAKIFGDNYTKPVDLLIKRNLLEINHVNPKTGEFRPEGFFSITDRITKSYRIPVRLRNGGCYQQVTITKTDKVMLNKIDQLNGMTKDQQKNREFWRNFVLNNMNELVLLDNYHCRQVWKDNCLKRGKPYSDDFATDKINTFNYNPFKPFRICDFGIRLHSGITNILKPIREFIRFAGNLESKLVEIDIVASQPWFLSIITPALIKKFAPECSDAIPFFRKYDKHPDLIKFRKLCPIKDSDNTDAIGIYKYFANAYNNMFGENFTRNDAKHICFRAFYSNYAKHEKLTLDKCQAKLVVAQNALLDAQSHYKDMARFGDQNQCKEAKNGLLVAQKRVKFATSLVFTHKCIKMFKSEFGGVYELLTAIKGLKWDFERGSKTAYTKYYANPALLAQRIESNIVYTIVVPALVAAGITKVVTIHDSFCVLEREASDARKVIIRALNLLKIKPSLQ